VGNYFKTIVNTKTNILDETAVPLLQTEIMSPGLHNQQIEY